MWYVDTIKIIKYFKVLQNVSDHKNDFVVSVDMDKVSIIYCVLVG